MAIISLQQTDTTAPCGFAAYCSTQGNSGGSTTATDCRVGGTPGTTDAQPDMVNLETRLHLVVFSTPDLGVTDWAAGDYIVRLNIAAASSEVTWQDTYVCRVNSSCVSQETLGSLTSQAQSLAAAIEVTMTISASSTTAAATDRLAFVLAFSNTGEHGGNDGFDYTPDSIITTPIEEAAAAARRVMLIN